MPSSAKITEPRSVSLDTEVIQAGARISNDQWMQAHDPRVYVEQHLDELSLQVSARAYASDPITVYWSVAMPASWWQHFKKEVIVPLTRNPSTPLGRHISRWALRWEHKRESYKQRVNRKVCPHLEIPPGDRHAHIAWLIDG